VDCRWLTDQPVGGFIGATMFTLSALKKKKAQTELQIQQLELALVLQRFLPSHQLPITVINEGGRWVCKFECSHNPLENAVAFGESPKQACDNLRQLRRPVERQRPHH
jgi:hypothetical protein